MHGTLKALRRGRQRRPHLQRHHTAVLRAFAAAQALMGDPYVPLNQKTAAEMYASTAAYIVAATTVMQSEDLDLIDQVMDGKVSLLEAAKRVRKRAQLVQAYRDADPADRIALGKTVGVDHVFDETVAPNL